MLKAVHTIGCQESFEVEFLCPKCHLPFCEEDSQQVLGGVLCGVVVNNLDIIYTKAELIKTQNNMRRITTTSENNYEVLETDNFIIANTSDNIVNIMLPSAVVNKGKFLTAIKINAGTKDVIITPQVGEKINGNNNEHINYRYGSRTIVCDGNEWIIYAKTP